jgi:translation initiation factor IF-3
MIRVPQVRVVDDEGSQLGVMPTAEAFRLAQERGLDLVEVAPMASPPVTRLLDYGHFKYEQARREKEARRHQRSVDFKEIRIKPKIGKGDFETKVRRAIQFLEDGDRIKVTCQFRGREVSHAHLGRDLLMRFAGLVEEHGTVERQPLLEGRSMSLVIASTHKPKSQRREEGADTEAAARPEGQAAPAAAGGATDGPASDSAAPAQPADEAEPAPAAPAKPREPAASASARPAGG